MRESCSSVILLKSILDIVPVYGSSLRLGLEDVGRVLLGHLERFLVDRIRLFPPVVAAPAHVGGFTRHANIPGLPEGCQDAMTNSRRNLNILDLEPFRA